jgi:GNAT superfamily N-acetyltransferase
MTLRIEPARPQDCGVLLELIGALAAYEKLAHAAVGTEGQLHRELFGERPVIEAVIGWAEARPVGFALFFHSFSTFLARRGLYLEDLFVVPDARRRGYGKALIRHVARVAVARGCGRFEWTVLDWNRTAIDFYVSIGATVLPDWRICRMHADALERFAAGADPAAT